MNRRDDCVGSLFATDSVAPKRPFQGRSS